MLVASSGVAAAQQSAVVGCKELQIEGEVRAGERFTRALGAGLTLELQPTTSGWILRVIPDAGGLRGYDYAEVATPPYRSVTPLSLSTDFAFRAQDAVGWNPRRFRFVTSRAAYEPMIAAAERLGPVGSVPPPGVEQTLAKGITGAAEGRLTLLDARLSAGSADQSPAAASVALHFSRTAHTLDSAGPQSALGKLLWVRFRVDLDVPSRFATTPELGAAAHPCSSR